MIEQVIIMAGGEGRRLRPLTEQRPKPLLPLLGQPVIAHTLHLLRRHGITHAAITLCYRAQDIMNALGNGSAYGVALDYQVEEIPRGTAGSVRDAAHSAAGTVLVLSGDSLTDADLTSLYTRHRASGAVFSMVVKRLAETSGYGICETDAAYRVTAFHEKPNPPPAHGLVNTGIYFIEPAALAQIPAAGAVDFANDLLPDLLSAGEKVQALETNAYWQDIGTPHAYAQAQQDMLSGLVALPVPGRRMGNAILGEDCRIAPDVRIAGRCYIGDGAQVEHGAVLGAGTVLLSGATVGASARLENACLWENACIDSGSILKNVVVMPQNGHASLQRIIPCHSS